jgi:fructokinase
MRLLSIGEILWDVFEDGERLGGAPLNVAIHAARLGHEVAILSGVGDDRRGEAALRAIREAGVADQWITRTKHRPTGTAQVVLDLRGNPSFDIARPAAFDETSVDPAILDAVVSWRPDWFVFGTLAQTGASTRRATEAVVGACPDASRLYDLNLRPGARDPTLVAALLAQASVVKMNAEEAQWLIDRLGPRSDPAAGLEASMRAVAAHHELRAVCVTRGAVGASLLLDRIFAEGEAISVPIADTVGAGDAFSAALAHGIAAGWSPARTVGMATRLGSLVAGRAGAVPAWTMDELDALA